METNVFVAWNGICQKKVVVYGFVFRICGFLRRQFLEIVFKQQRLTPTVRKSPFLGVR